MKKKSWLFIMTLVFSLIVYSFSPTVSAATNDSNLNDVYQNQESETVLIEGISYTYDYRYEDNNRTIYITNNSNNLVEKVSYHENNSTIYYNDEEFLTLEIDDNTELNSPSSITTKAKNTWETISTGSKYISWAKGVTVSVLAGIIAVGLGYIAFGATAAIVISSMGASTLSIIASAAIGGTIKTKYQRFMPSFGAPYHRWIWSFTASTGDFYGNYIYQ